MESVHSDSEACRVPPSLTAVGARVESRILTFLDEELLRWKQVDPDLEDPLTSLRELVLAGGKRLRPAFCHWAFVGAGGDPDDARVVDAGAALELLHTFALVHDDIMDGSDRRRGLPAVHRQFIAAHDRRHGQGEARRYGEGVAILVGDFAFVYADVLMADMGDAARQVYDELRIELCVGQYLDLVGTAGDGYDPVQAGRIGRYKSGTYTVERPLHLGAAMAGRSDELAGAFSAFGLPLGAAFQLRDDLLGVFGDASVTGKPVGDDLREGKLTPLTAAAHARAIGADAELLTRIGAVDLADDEVRALQDLLVRVGANDEIEARIEMLVAEALTALDAAPITDEAAQSLAELAVYIARRDR
jgi:geranylgeranyl diphosphate synthase type I